MSKHDTAMPVVLYGNGLLHATNTMLADDPCTARLAGAQAYRSENASSQSGPPVRAALKGVVHHRPHSCIHYLVITMYYQANFGQALLLVDVHCASDLPLCM
jgi:hypothetical protein